jgi:hypothetical protein
MFNIPMIKNHLIDHNYSIQSIQSHFPPNNNLNTDFVCLKMGFLIIASKNIFFY